MALLVTSKILGHFANTLTSNDTYSLPNSENFEQPIQMHISKKWIIFSEFFLPILKYISVFKHFERKDDPHSFSISENKDCKRHGYTNFLKAPFQNTLRQSTYKGSQTLLKSALQHVYQISSSLWAKPNGKIFLSVICKILGHFFNKLTGSDK